MSINKHEQVTQEKNRNDIWQFILYIKAQDSQGQFFHKRFNQEILKSTQLEIHRNKPLISTWLLFFKNYDHPNYWIKSQNPMSICFIESREIFLWISYETYCLKVSLSKKLILSQFSQKEITIFLWKQKQKLKNTKRKKKYILPTVCLPLTYLKKKMSLMDLFWGGNEKNVTSGSIWPYVKIYFL